MSCCCKKSVGSYYARPYAAPVAVAGAVSPYAAPGAVAGAFSPYTGAALGPCPTPFCPDGGCPTGVIPGAVAGVGVGVVPGYCEKSCPDYLPNEPIGVGGISSPCYNNTDVPCGCTLRDAACRLINQKAIIHVEGCKMAVIIIAVGKCFIKTVNYATNKVIYFNLSRINSIEDVLPRY